MQNRDQLYINGQWAASAGGKFIDVINASTEEAMGRVPEGTAQDVDAKYLKTDVDTTRTDDDEHEGDSFMQRLTRM